MISKRQNYDNSSCLEVTFGIILSSFALPTVLAMAGTIAVGAAVLNILGNIVVYFTLFGFFLDTKARQDAALICRKFYFSICHLERDKSLKLDEKIMDDQIFESMLHSSRRFKEISVDGHGFEERALRIGIVLGKFKNHTKELSVSPFPLYSRAISSPIMDAMSDVEELSVSWTHDYKIKTKSCFDLQKDFKNLKKLKFTGDYEISAILEIVPDDTLETLSLSRGYGTRRPPNQEYLQAFLDRQTQLKELTFPDGMKLELGHLDLEELTLKIEDEELTLDVEGDKWLADVLKQQPLLRVLLARSIDSASFIELQKLRYLEVLRGSFAKNMRGQFTNLKELRVSVPFSGDASVLLQVAFPKLTRLKVIEENEFEELDEDDEPHSLGPEHIIALSRTAPNLQQIAIKNNRIDYLPTILENFPNLDALVVEPLAVGALNFTPPTRQNVCLKQLIVRRHVYGHETPDADIYQTIAMCPNLERIALFDIVFTELEILNLILDHPRLTHFYFRSENENNLFNQHGLDFLDPDLLAIINIFKNSPAFVYLRFYNIYDIENQLLEDALAEDVDRIEVIQNNSQETCRLLLFKKVEDHFKRFYKKEISDDF